MAIGHSRLCPVCNHPDRGEIELAVLSITPAKPELTLEVIADAYGLSVDELRAHALMHTPLALNFSKESSDALVRNFQSKAGVDATSRPNPTSESEVSQPNGRERIADRVNMREGDLLLAAANEYITTMTILGRRIKSYASSRDNDSALPNFCTKAVVDLYIGCGSEIRQAIKGLNELNTSLNGSHDAGSEGLKALADAIRGSANPTEGPSMMDDSVQ